MSKFLPVEAGTRKNMRGQPIIFLGVLAIAWTASRVIAYLPGIAATGITDSAQAFAKVDSPANIFATALAMQPADAKLTRDERPIWQTTRHIILLPEKYEHSYNSVYPLNATALSYSAGIVPSLPENRATALLSTAPDRGDAQRVPVTQRIQPLANPDSGYSDTGHNFADRLSLQAWGFLRPGSSGALTAGRGQYGASQVGAIARYALTPSSERRGEIYLRFASALKSRGSGGLEETELALGVSARPVASVPIVVAAEQRVGIGGDGRTRSAAYAVTQLPPARLPANISASAYAQVGIVGIKQTQAFYDVQMLAERPAFQRGNLQVTVGAGLWSGGQTGATAQEQDIFRVDIGPRISTSLPVGAGRARLSLDYRARIAGNATPGSGAVLTLSGDF